MNHSNQGAALKYPSPSSAQPIGNHPFSCHPRYTADSPLVAQALLLLSLLAAIPFFPLSLG